MTVYNRVLSCAILASVSGCASLGITAEEGDKMFWVGLGGVAGAAFVYRYALDPLLNPPQWGVMYSGPRRDASQTARFVVPVGTALSSSMVVPDSVYGRKERRGHNHYEGLPGSYTLSLSAPISGQRCESLGLTSLSCIPRSGSPEQSRVGCALTFRADAGATYTLSAERDQSSPTVISGVPGTVRLQFITFEIRDSRTKSVVDSCRRP
jgi:hypothetical protein